MGIEIKREKMQKGWKYFNIMHKDRRVARIYEDGRCTINYPSFKSGSLNLSEFARVCGLSRTTVYKYVGILEG